MGEVAILEESTVLSATSSHAQKQAVFLEGKKADVSGNIWETSDAIRGQHGSKRSGERASLSLAIQSGEFLPHRQQDGCALLSLGFCARSRQSLPPYPAPVNATTVPGKRHSCRPVTKAERPPQTNSCKEGPSNTNQCLRAQLAMYNLSLTSLLPLPVVKSPQKHL